MLFKRLLSIARDRMIGIIQKILLDMIETEAGSAGLDRLKREAGIPSDTIYRIDTVYPDGECLKLFEIAGKILSLETPALFERYSGYFCRDALQRWPTWFETSKSSREFLERQPTIHNCFATGLRDAEARKAVTDKFRIERTAEGLITHYRSPNRLCGLYKALGRWIVDYYGERVEIQEPTCMLRGDPQCDIHIHWI